MKNTAKRIIEARLIKALDRNDGNAVREACIVLQAMERKADVQATEPIDPNKYFNADTEKAQIVQVVNNSVLDQVKNTISRGVISQILDALSEKDYEHAREVTKEVIDNAYMDAQILYETNKENSPTESEIKEQIQKCIQTLSRYLDKSAIDAILSAGGDTIHLFTGFGNFDGNKIGDDFIDRDEDNRITLNDMEPLKYTGLLVMTLTDLIGLIVILLAIGYRKRY